MFEDNENVYLINKMDNESNKFHFTKCKFLSNILKSQSHKNNSSKLKMGYPLKMDYNLKMANIYTNHKLNHCVYSDSTMKELNKIIS
jgi:hypothetical protein